MILALFLIFLMPLNALPTSGSTLFFDDFLSSQVSPNWNYNTIHAAPNFLNGNLTQSGGWLGLTVNRAVFPVQAVGLMGLISNTTDPIISGNSPNGTFVFMSWKMIPFNFTQVGNVIQSNTGQKTYKNGAILVGLFNPGPGMSGLGFELSESDSSAGIAVINNQRESVGVAILNPMYPTLMPQCFSQINGIGMLLPSGLAKPNCTTKNSMILYSNANAVLDLNTVHLFTMELRINSPNSWAAFQVDNNAFYNVTNSACSCLDVAGGHFESLYPNINIVYAMGSAASGNVVATPNQSMTTQIDWTLFDNYVPASFPAGQLLSSGANPPTVLVQPGVTGSLTQFIQFEANSISPGNIYAGGMMLFGLIGFILFSIMGITARRTGASLRTFGMFYSIMALGLAFFGFYCQVLPVMIPVTLAIVTFAITFGVIRTGQASGGVVPD